jgi:hypothetical protein
VVEEIRTCGLVSSRHVVTLEDATGSVLVRVPEHLLRALNEGASRRSDAVCAGGGGHAALDDRQGIHAQTAQRVE